MRLLITLALLITVTTAKPSDLSNIREVLKYVETEYNPEAIGDGGDSWGILQIQKGVILDINRKYGTDYTHQDAFDVTCAEEIFELYIKMWTEKLESREQRPATEEDIVRIWNGGPRGWKKDSTLKYLKKYRKYKTIYYDILQEYPRENQSNHQQEDGGCDDGARPHLRCVYVQRQENDVWCVQGCNPYPS